MLALARLSSYTACNVEMQGHILVITMIRHARRNAIADQMTLALDVALNRLEDEPELWTTVITGGPDMFCAGTDMAATSGTPTPRGGIYGVVGRTRTKPLLAAVEGVAFGGGFEVVMACDMVLTATNARFGLPEVKRGQALAEKAMMAAVKPLADKQTGHQSRRYYLHGIRLDTYRRQCG